jgi:hypothetical protein
MAHLRRGERIERAQNQIAAGCISRFGIVSERTHHALLTRGPAAPIRGLRLRPKPAGGMHNAAWLVRPRGME